MILTITDSDETEVVKLHIGEIDDHAKATVAILTALATLPAPPRRRGRGKKTVNAPKPAIA